MIHELMMPATAGKGPAVTCVCHRPEGSTVPELGLDELLGTVAHELRSPLAETLSGVYLITSESDPDPIARRALIVMERQLRQAIQIVDDLFDVSAGGLGKLSLHKEVVTLTEVVKRATESVAHFLTARRHRLTVSLPAVPVSLEADPLRLAQALTNLLSNAAKFTDAGGHIRLSAEVEDAQIILRVGDNGPGIAPDLLPHVFDLFRQGPDGTRHTQAGLCIGLALVKSLVELHGGSVAAHSDGPDLGAEFVVRLPSPQPTAGYRCVSDMKR